MKKTFIYYSILGCFATGAATASPLYINFDGACPDNTLCRVLPNAGQCCAANETVSKINLPTGSNGWSLSIGTSTIQIFDADGYPTISSLSDTQKMIINNAIAGGATLSGAVIPASEQLVSVTLDMKGGSLPVGFENNTRAMHPGDLVLSAGVTRSDNAKLVGFYAEGANPSTATPIVTVGTATTQKYIAKYTCDNDSRTTMNSKGTCVDENTIYIGADGNVVSPGVVDASSGDSSGCTWVSYGTVTLHDYNPNTDVPNGFVNNMYYYMYLNSVGEPDNNIVADTDDDTYMWTNSTAGQSSCPPTFPETGWVSLNNINDLSNHTTNDGDQFLHSGMPNNNRKLFCRSRGCWLESAGAEQPKAKYYAYNPNGGTCATFSNCSRMYQNYSNLCYYACPCSESLTAPSGSVWTLSTSCVDTSLSFSYSQEAQQVTDSETGETTTEYVMVAIPGSDAHVTNEQAQWIRSLRQPKAVGWTFRGYYRNVSGVDWFAESNSTTDAAAKFFGVGNPNNREISVMPPISVYVCPTDNEGNDKIGYDIHLYGAWARNCDSYTAPAVYQQTLSCCDQTTTVNGVTQCATGHSHSYTNPYYNTNWDGNTLCKLNISNGGDVSYNTSCIDGYTVTANSGTYNPTCTGETGTVNITYVIKDQYGRTVSREQNFINVSIDMGDEHTWNGYNYNQCSLHPFVPNGNDASDDFYRILDQVTFEHPESGQASNSGYILKYLATNSGNNQNWYTPSHHIPCSANEFGFVYNSGTTNYNTEIMGLACKEICNLNTPTSGLSSNVARCIEDEWNNVESTTVVTLDGTSYSVPNCYRLVNDSLCIENLLQGCPTYQCDSGYKLCVPTSTADLSVDPQCVSASSSCPDNTMDASSASDPIPYIMTDGRGVQMR